MESMRVAVVKVFLGLLLTMFVGGPFLVGQKAMAQTPAASASATPRIA